MQFCFMSTVLYAGTRKFLRSLLVLQIIVCGKKPRKLQKPIYFCCNHTTCQNELSFHSHHTSYII